MKIQRDIIRTRKAVRRRTVITQANNNLVNEWTLSKMIEKVNKTKDLENKIKLEKEKIE